MIKAIIQAAFRKPGQSTTASVVLLILRLIAGIAFILHGWQKIQHPTAWVPLGGPLSIAPFFQFLAAVSEFCGGIAWVLGFLTPLASFGIACTMAVAVYLNIELFKAPFVNLTGGPAYELPLAYLGIALLLFILGPGKLSLDSQLFGKRTQ